MGGSTMACHAAAHQLLGLQACFRSHPFRPEDARMAVRDLERARTVYGDIRAYWVAKGSALEAHERLGVVTVAAGLRDFAFLTHIGAEVQPSITDLLRRNGLLAEPCSSAFDIDIEPEGIAAATVEVYKRAQRESRPLSGLGLWSAHL